MDAELQNINQGMHMEIKEELFENDETLLESDDNETHLSNEFSQEMDENFQTDDNIYVSENSHHGNVKLVEIINVRQENQEQEKLISDIKDRSYLEDDSNFKNIEQTIEKSDFVIKTEILSGDLEAGCSYHEDSNIVAEDSYVKVDLDPESGDRTNEEIDAKLENSGSFIDSFVPITKNDLHPDLQEQVSSDQPHIGNYDPPDKWVCINYEKGFKTQNDLGQYSIRADDHMMKYSSTARTHQCNICEKEFKVKHKLLDHMLSHSNERPHQCNICNKGFKTKRNLRNHMICHSTESLFQCNICESRFKYKHHLKIHMISHSTEKPHQCNFCKKGFKYKQHLKIHTASHSSERPHQCDMCEKRFKTTPDLRQHKISHSTERPHQCSMCEKVFKTINDLKCHIMRHTTDRPHQCNMCKKDFKTMYELRKHLITHNTEFQLQCKMCEKEFETKYELRIHMASHSSEMPHQCNMCEKGFKTLPELRQHMISHSTARPHQCDICDKAFKTIINLRRHMSVHNTKKPHQSVQ